MTADGVFQNVDSIPQYNSLEVQAVLKTVNTINISANMLYNIHKVSGQLDYCILGLKYHNELYDHMTVSKTKA